MEKSVDLGKLKSLDCLIRQVATGSHGELAERLSISRSGLFDLIAFLKEEMQAPIYFNQNRLSYMYLFTPDYCLGFAGERLATTEKKNTSFKETIFDTVVPSLKSDNLQISDIQLLRRDFIKNNNLFFTVRYFWTRLLYFCAKFK